MDIKPLKIAPLPDSLSLRKLIGPSFIILGLGLGSGEIVMWPYLTTRYGMGIIWGAVLGITFQFIMNMEIERYALVNGESIFVGFARKLKFLPAWFILSTFIPWMWPGIIVSAATIYGSLLNISNVNVLATIFLVVIGLILSLGSVLYKTVENLQKTLISIGVPFILILTVILAQQNDWIALGRGLVGIGDGYNFLPVGISFASFLGALAFAGAGGNLNLAQSNYVKEKGYGMGKYSGRITSLLNKKKEETSLSGTTFEVTPENLQNFKKWWKNVNIEPIAIFWVTGAFTILALAFLAYITAYGEGDLSNNISFVLKEGAAIGARTAPWAGVFFLIVAATTLFATQLTVLDATTRIMSENLLLMVKRLKETQLSTVYYMLLWGQILAGILILSFGFSQPIQLLTIAAVLNAVAMFIHTGLTLWVNLTLLHKEVRPSALRIIMMVLAFSFYGGFSIYTVYGYLK